jgi:multidrug efflux system membrane fusion protein
VRWWQGDLITIDPAPYAAGVDRAQAQVAAAQARAADQGRLERGERFRSRIISQVHAASTPQPVEVSA